MPPSVTELTSDIWILIPETLRWKDLSLCWKKKLHPILLMFLAFVFLALENSIDFTFIFYLGAHNAKNDWKPFFHNFLTWTIIFLFEANPDCICKFETLAQIVYEGIGFPWSILSVLHVNTILDLTSTIADGGLISWLSNRRPCKNTFS